MKRLLVGCVLTAILGILLILLNESYQGSSRPSKELRTQMLRSTINELLKDAVRDGVAFPSMDNKEVVKALDHSDLGKYLTQNHILRNENGEILDLWGRPYGFYRHGDRVTVFSYGPPH